MYERGEGTGQWAWGGGPRAGAESRTVGARERTVPAEEVDRTGWRLVHWCVGVGAGFQEVAEGVVDEGGRHVTGAIGYATQILTDDSEHVENLRRLLERTGRPVFFRGEDFPHSDQARLIAAAPLLRRVLRRVDRFVSNGIEMGYISLPDEDDPAHEVPGLVREALEITAGSEG